MKKIFTYLEENLEEILMVILLGAIALVIFAQVIARLFDKGFPWAEEFCRYCFVYTGMISAGYCIRKGVGIRVDALYSFFPKAVQLVIDYAGKILLTGTVPSYYAFPSFCADLEGLPPHYIVVGEYDTLRDDGINYAVRLLQTGVPCEMVVAPRVGHGFCVVDHPLTHWVHKGICGSLRREFQMEITEF